MIDLNVQLVDLGVTSVDELVRKNEDDSYTILLNSRQASNRLLSAYNHALRHISRRDHDTAGDVQEIEYENHRRETK